MATRRIDITITANASNVTGVMNSVAQSVNNATTSVKNMAGPFASVQKQFTATVSNTKLATGSINTFGSATTQTTSKLQAFGEKFGENTGIVFGVAGLTSALGEAVGMMGMYGDTAARLGEAQSNLNNLISKGVDEGHAYTQAQNEVTKQQRFFNMVQRNTILSQMDMIFFTTMVINGLVKLGKETSGASGILGKLRNVFFATKMEAVALSPAVNLYAASTVTATAGTNTLSGALAFLKANLRGVLMLTGIGAAIVVISMLAEHFMAAADASNKASDAMKNSVNRINSDLEAFQAIAARDMTEVATQAENMSDGSIQSFDAIVAAAQSMAMNTGKSFDQMILKQMEAMKRSLEMTAQLKQQHIDFMEAHKVDPKLGSWQAVQGKIFDQTEIDNWKKDLKAVNDQLDIVNGTITKTQAAIKGVGDTTKFTSLTFAQFKGAVTEANSTMSTSQDIAMNFISNMQQLKAENGGVAFSIDAVREKANQEVLALRQLGTEQTGLTESDLQGFLKIVNDFLDQQEQKAKDDAAALKTLGGESTSLAEAQNNFFAAMEQGFQPALNRYQAIVTGVQMWKDANASTLPMMEASGTAVNSLTQFLTKYGFTITEIAIATGVYNTAKKQEVKANKDALKEQEAQNKVLDDYIQKLHESKVAVSQHMTTNTENIEFNKLLTDAYNDNIKSILDKVRALNAEKQMWASLKPEEITAVNLAQEQLKAQAELIPMLEGGHQAIFAYNKALIAGKQAVSDSIESTLEQNVSLDVSRNRWVQLTQDLFPFIDTTRMTTDELQDLVTNGLDTTSDAVERLARTVDENALAALKDLDSVLGAGNNKDFNKAWKELDLGSIPNKFKDDFKKMAQEMRGFTEKGNEVKIGLDLVNTALSQAGQMTHEVSFEEIHKTMKEVIKDFGDFARLDPESWELFNSFPELFDDLQKHTEKFPLTMALFNEAIREGGFNASSSAKFLQAYVLEGGKLEDISEKDREKLELLGIQFDENGKPITDATDDTNKFTEAMQKLSTEAIVVQTIADMWILLTETLAEANDLIVQDWADTGIEILKKTAITDQAVFDMWSLTAETMAEESLALAQHWSKMCQSMMKNASAAGNGIIKNIKSGMDKSASNMLALAKHWSKMCNSMIANAKSAASGISKALAGIKDEEVKINFVKTGAVPNSEGGVYSFDKGGTISAAGGMNVSNGPTLTALYGDNSGGREIQAFIPMDGHKADRIMSLINAQLGRKEGASGVIVANGGDKEITVPIVINIGDQQFSFTKKYRIRQGRDIAQQVY